MRMSQTISDLATALAKAQGAIDDAQKGSLNPHFKSRYADLAAVRAAIREPLAVNDLSYVQFARVAGSTVEVETMLLHKSGEYMAETLAMPVGKPDAQGIGSAITYARRYSLMAMIGIAPDDDDGNAAVQGNGRKQAPSNDTTSLLQEGEARADAGVNALRDWWQGLRPEERNVIGDKGLASLKERAAKAAPPATQEAA